MFAFSALFSAVGLAAAFDDAVTRDAHNGRLNRQLATLAATEYGLPTLTPEGQPLNKSQALKLAADYRATLGRGVSRKPTVRRALGAMFDALALGLELGAPPAPDDVQGCASYAERLAALVARGGYLGDADAWASAIPGAVRKAKGEGEPAADDDSEPLQVQGKGEKSAQDAGTVSTGADYAAALALVLSGLAAGAYGDADKAALCIALGVAVGDAAPVSISEGIANAATLTVAAAENDALSVGELVDIRDAALRALEREAAAEAAPL